MYDQINITLICEKTKKYLKLKHSFIYSIKYRYSYYCKKNFMNL